jgi:hypothetical protein
LDFAINILPPLELILLVLWEITGEAVKMVCRTEQFAEPW